METQFIKPAKTREFKSSFLVSVDDLNDWYPPPNNLRGTLEYLHKIPCGSRPPRGKRVRRASEILEDYLRVDNFGGRLHVRQTVQGFCFNQQRYLKNLEAAVDDITASEDKLFMEALCAQQRRSSL